mgnify:CR=1 FL=1
MLPTPAMNWRRIAFVVALLYLTLCMVVFWQPQFFVTIFEHLPSWLEPVLVTVVGPVLLLLDDGGLGIFVGAVGLVAGSLASSWLFSRWWPQSEWFAVGLFSAILVWVTSGWLVVLLNE